MKTQIVVGTMCLLASSLLAADLQTQVSDAAQKLVKEGNYSWHQTTENGASASGRRFRMGPTEGKVIQDGTTCISRTFRDNTRMVVLKGKKGAIQTQDGWESLADMSQGRGRFFARMYRNFKAPAAQVADILSKTKGLKEDDGVISGDLTDQGVSALLFPGGMRRGGNAPEPSNAKGWVKFWVKDGSLTKFQYNVQAGLSFNGRDFNIDRTTTVQFKDVGTTKIDVPAEAKDKLSS